MKSVMNFEEFRSVIIERLLMVVIMMMMMMVLVLTSVLVKRAIDLLQILIDK